MSTVTENQAELAAAVQEGVSAVGSIPVITDEKQLDELLRSTTSDPRIEIVYKVKERAVYNSDGSLKVETSVVDGQEVQTQVTEKYTSDEIDYTESKVCGISCTTPFENLSSDQVETLNEFAVQNTKLAWITMTKRVVMKLLGLVEIKNSAEQIAWYKTKETAYASTRNATNRQTKETVAKDYADEMKNGTWASGPGVGAVDCLGNVQTLAHRAMASLIANDSGQLLVPPVILVSFGGYPQAANVADTGRPNTKGDVLYRDPDIMPDQLWVEIAEVIPPADKRAKLRADGAKQLTTLLSNLNQRMKGKDVHAGGGNGFTTRDARDLRSKFPQFAIDKLMLECLHNSKNQKGQNVDWAKYINPNLVALCIILLSNKNKPAGYGYGPTDKLDIDQNLVDAMLNGLSQSGLVVNAEDKITGVNGAWGPLLEQLHLLGKNLKPATMTAEAKLNVFVGWLSNFPESVGFPTDDKGRILAWSWKYQPSLKDNPEYRHFGGIDRGYVKPEPKKTAKSAG